MVGNKNAPCSSPVRKNKEFVYELTLLMAKKLFSNIKKEQHVISKQYS